MPTLAEHIAKPEKRTAVIADLVKLVDEEVAGKGGLSGIGIKTAYGLVKAIKPGFVPDVIDGMFDDCIKKLEPIFAESVAKGGSLAAAFSARAPAVADALLSVTDERAERTTHNTAKKAYSKLRPTGKRNVEEAVPRLGALLEKHTRA